MIRRHCWIATIASILAAGIPASGQSPAVQPRYSAEVGALLEDARVQAAMEHLRQQTAEARRLLIELTQIPAPPFGEAARARRYAELLREAGLAGVTIDRAGNVVGRRPGHDSSRTIAVSAHLDTVFPEGTDVTVREEGDRLFAPGIGDNTRGLVVVLGVLKALEQSGIATDADVLFVGDVGEEGLGDLRGVKHLFRDGAEKIATLIAVDGGRASRIVYGGVGSHRYRVTFQGPGGHSWGAFGTANPHHALGRAIALFDQNAPAVTSEGEKTSYNIGRIGGGTSINSIPFESWMEVDMRSGSQEKLDAIDAVFQDAVRQALEEENQGRLEGPELTVDVQRVGTRPAARGDTGAAVVQRAMAAMQALGLEPELGISSTDANLPLSKGIPAVTLSRGGISRDSHAPGESWEDVDSHIGMQIVLLTLLAEAGLAP